MMSVFKMALKDFIIICTLLAFISIMTVTCRHPLLIIDFSRTNNIANKNISFNLLCCYLH